MLKTTSGTRFGLLGVFLELQREIWHSRYMATSQRDAPDSAAGTLTALVGGSDGREHSDP